MENLMVYLTYTDDDYVGSRGIFWTLTPRTVPILPKKVKSMPKIENFEIPPPPAFCLRHNIPRANLSSLWLSRGRGCNLYIHMLNIPFYKVKITSKGLPHTYFRHCAGAQSPKNPPNSPHNHHQVSCGRKLKNNTFVFTGEKTFLLL